MTSEQVSKNTAYADMYGLTGGATTIYIFTNSENISLQRINRTQETPRYDIVTLLLTPFRRVGKITENVTGKKNSPMILNTLVGNGWN
jgi:hypothetical protein